jgi:hypothetical protein
MTKKETNPILRANGGLHSRRALKKIEERLQNHGMKKAILVHFVLTGSQIVQTYRDAYNEIAEELRSHGCTTEFFGCLEMDEIKGLHAHIYYLIETLKKFPKPILNVNDGEFLHNLSIKYGINRPHIAKPENPIHYSNGKKQFFARPTAGEKLDDCLQRIAYLYKNRSKEGVPCREIYFNSEFNANVAKRQAKRKTNPYLLAAALPAAAEVAPIALTKETKDETRTTAEQEGSQPVSASEKDSSTSAEAVVCAGQCASASKEAPSQQEASPSTKRDSGNGISPNYEGPQMILTAAQKYLASLYERCIDADMDTDEIRRYLLAKGVVRTPGQVAWELEHVFAFTGYADNHIPKPVISVQQWDRTAYRASSASKPA